MSQIIKGRFLSVGQLIEFLEKFPRDAKVGPYERNAASGVVVFEERDGHTVSLGYSECEPVAAALRDDADH